MFCVRVQTFPLLINLVTTAEQFARSKRPPHPRACIFIMQFHNTSDIFLRQNVIYKANFPSIILKNLQNIVHLKHMKDCVNLIYKRCLSKNKRIVVVWHESQFAWWQTTLYNTAYQRCFFKAWILLLRLLKRSSDLNNLRKKRQTTICSCGRCCYWNLSISLLFRRNLHIKITAATLYSKIQIWTYMFKWSSGEILQCNHHNRGHVDKVNQSDYRKIHVTMHSEKASCQTYIPVIEINKMHRNQPITTSICDLLNLLKKAHVSWKVH